MLDKFFKSDTRRPEQSVLSPLTTATAKGKFVGDCAICRKVFRGVSATVFLRHDVEKAKLSGFGGCCYYCDMEFCSLHVLWEELTASSLQATREYLFELAHNLPDYDENSIRQILNQTVDYGCRALCPRCKRELNNWPDAFMEAYDAEDFERATHVAERARLLGVQTTPNDLIPKLIGEMKAKTVLKLAEEAETAEAKQDLEYAIAQGRRALEVASGMMSVQISELLNVIEQKIAGWRRQFAAKLKEDGDRAIADRDFAKAITLYQRVLEVMSPDLLPKQPGLKESIENTINGLHAQWGLKLQEEAENALNAGDFELTMSLWDNVEQISATLVLPPGPEGDKLRKAMRHEVSTGRLKTLNACLTRGDESRKAGQLNQAVQWYDRGLQLMSAAQSKENKFFTSAEAYQENHDRVGAMRDKTKSDALRKDGQAAWAAQDYERAAPLLEESNRLLLPFSGEPAVASILKNVRLQLFQHYVRAAGKAEQEHNLARTEEYYSKILAVAEPYVEITDMAQAVHQVLLARGLLYHGQGNYKMALADFQQSVEVRPNNELAHYNAACACARLGQREQALQSLRRSFELDVAKGQKTQVTAAKTDSDFDSLRTMPQFRALLAQFGA